MQERSPWGNGWILVGWFSLVALCILVLFQFKVGLHEEGLRSGIRLSARISTLLFLSAFLARPCFLFRKNGFTRWLMMNRRYFGVSFASVHTMHLALILSLASLSPTFVHSLHPTTLIGGGLGYVFIYAMTATSFDAAVKWLGGRHWKILHTTGLYYLWFIFALTYMGRLKESFFYFPMTFLVMGAMVFRLWILLKKGIREKKV